MLQMWLGEPSERAKGVLQRAECTGGNRTVVVEVLWKMGEGEVVGEEIGYCKGLGPDDMVSSCQ
jgi:hypothetical protein